MHRWRSSLVGRLSLLVAAASIAFVAILFAVTDFAVERVGRDTLANTIDTDIAGLADVFASGGRGELVARVADRMALAPVSNDPAYYLVADSAGRPLAGNIDAWPSLSAENSDLGIIKLDGGEALARATQLSADTRIVVARGTASRDAMRTRIATAFLGAGIAIVLGAMLLGWWYARALRRRITGVNSAYAAIASGDISARAPAEGKGDEIDLLVGRTNAMLDRVSALVTAHRDMSDHLAHEIRTPLLHLDGRLLAAISDCDDPALVKLLGSARQDIRSITTMLDSLLDIASSTARRGDRTGLVLLDLSDLVSEVADIFRDSADELGRGFYTHIIPGIMVEGDRMQLIRMLSNLIDNAFKYTSPGGHVSLTLGPGPRIAVSDDGPGIPADLRETIFDRFSRGVFEGTPNQGHGLGLSLALAIARRHSLTLTCEDADVGACFVIRPEGEPS